MSSPAIQWSLSDQDTCGSRCQVEPIFRLAFPLEWILINYNKWILASVTVFLIAGCSIPSVEPAGGSAGTGNNSQTGNQNQTGTTTPSTGGSTVTPPGGNVMTVTVNGSLCGPASNQYNNEPCTSVTLCQAGTSNCQTIDDLLVDTGSFGLRIFSSAITVPMTPEKTASGGTLAECINYGDGSSQWGPVETVDVILGQEPAVAMPIQVINSSFGGASNCGTPQDPPQSSPQQAHFNGIIGVGLLAQDCGPTCVNSTTFEQYFSCSGSNCSLTTVSLAEQVTNPISLLPVDNNGLIFQLPSVAATGAASVSGTITLGIGTQSNNTPAAGVTVLGAAPSTVILGNDTLSTVFSSYSNKAVAGFIDSGSNYLYIPPPSGNSVPNCGVANKVSYSGFFCPTSQVSFSAENESVTSSSTSAVSFEIGNAIDLLTSTNMVFGNIGFNAGGGADASFDWGLPFFFGRTIYVGIEATKSSLGTGPYWAY